MTDVGFKKTKTLEKVSRMTHEEFKKRVDDNANKRAQKMLSKNPKKTKQEFMIKNLRKGDHVIFKKNNVNECGLIINKYETEFDIKQRVGNFVITGLINFDRVVRKAYPSDIEKVEIVKNTNTNVSLFAGNI
jgi:hypothetical protein|tara:strand:- start:47 stop:442 length:396 start_codon:yes stop_codon:yes gene_type:complete